jgi:ATP-dependent DNA helicase RecG
MDLKDPLEKHFRLRPTQTRALSKMGLRSIENLLYHLPTRYVGEQDFVIAKVMSGNTRKGWSKRVPIAEMQLEDLAGRKIRAIWFSQAYMAKLFPEGTVVRLSGKSKDYRGTISFTNPKIERANEETSPGQLFENGSPCLVPIYPKSRGISSLWLTYAIQKVIKSGLPEKLEDPIPGEVLRRYNLPTLSSSIVIIHSPKRDSDARAARKRFAFQEIFLIQLSHQMAKHVYEQKKGYRIAGKSAAEEFTKRLSFVPTGAQVKALDSILSDMSKGRPMMRLLEGDVGSGKTFVAAAAAYAAIQSSLQVAYMAPTEILAKQHFESFVGFYKHLPDIEIGLLTGSECRKFPSKIGTVATGTHISRTLMLKRIAAGQMNIVIGTHAHIAPSVKWQKLALAIIDEQHRFGTKQRASLAHKGILAPHLLSMTATPIPRTLALTIYGDLDLTLLDESPPGRKPIVTKVVSPKAREGVYEHIREEIRSGRQTYVICPRIDEPDPEKELALETKDVKTETDKLGNDIFPEYVVGMIHGKMKPSEKEEIMGEFARGEIHILVATSVVEVGVNVPNATVIIIEGAERFGLAQLHQLRGRVLRSSHQAYCYLFTSSEDSAVPKRLAIIEKAKNGFELAEEDLKLRGPGSLGGGKQWGISDVGMEALQNLKMVEAARIEAKNILGKDPSLDQYPTLAKQRTSALRHLE